MNWLTTCRLKRNETLPQGNRLHKVGHEFPNIKFHPLSASYRGEFVAVTMDVVWLPCRTGGSRGNSVQVMYEEDCFAVLKVTLARNGKKIS